MQYLFANHFGINDVTPLILKYLDEPDLHSLHKINKLAKYFSSKELLRRCFDLYTRQTIPFPPKSFTLSTNTGNCMFFKITDGNGISIPFSEKEMMEKTITIGSDFPRNLEYFHLITQKHCMDHVYKNLFMFGIMYGRANIMARVFKPISMVFNFVIPQPCFIHTVTFPQSCDVDQILKTERQCLENPPVGTLSWLCSDYV